MVERYGINKYQCIDSEDWHLQGNYYTDVYSYVSIKLFKCQNVTANATNSGSSLPCFNQSYIDSFLNTMTLSFAYTNSMFDTENYQNPTKTFIDDSLFINLDASRFKSANMFVQENQVQL